MSKNILSKEWFKKHDEKVKEAYHIAVEEKYDIASEETALILLKLVDPEDITNEKAQAFSRVLQLLDRIAKKKLARREKLN